MALALVFSHIGRPVLCWVCLRSSFQAEGREAQEKLVEEVKAKMQDLSAQIASTAPNLKALEQYEAIKEKEKEVIGEFESIRTHAKEVTDEFLDVRRQRSVTALLTGSPPLAGPQPLSLLSSGDVFLCAHQGPVILCPFGTAVGDTPHTSRRTNIISDVWVRLKAERGTPLVPPVGAGQLALYRSSCVGAVYVGTPAKCHGFRPHAVLCVRVVLCFWVNAGPSASCVRLTTSPGPSIASTRTSQ